MKRGLLFVFILCGFSHLFSQEQSIIPWGDIAGTSGIGEDVSSTFSMQQGYKYRIGYHKNGKLKYIWGTDFIRPIMDENEVIGTGPWEGNVTISPSTMNYESIAKEVLKPYYKVADSCSIHIAAFYDLSGSFLKFELEIPAEVNIPIQVIEELDSRLKKESKLQLEYDPEKAKYVNYITLSTTPILQRYEDDCLKIEYEKTDSNTYVIKRYGPNTKYISNINNPYEGIGTGGWRGRIKELFFLVSPDTIIEV